MMRFADRVGAMTDRSRRLLAAAMIVAAPALTVLTYLVCRDQLPETIAGQFDWFFPGWRSGEPAGRSVITSLIGVAPALGVALFLVAKAKSDKARMGVVGIAVTIFSFCAYEIAALLVSYGAESYADIEQHWWQGAVALWASFLAAAGLERVLPPDRLSDRTLPKSDLSLSPHEHVVWLGRSSSRAFLVAAAVISAGGLAVMTVSGSLGVFLLIVAVFAFWARRTFVRIDDAGLHVHVGPFGRRGFDVPLNRIVRAEFRMLDPFDGGQWRWGYRRGRSVILRRGEGIVVECTDRPAIAVTVDGAREAVDVLNALVVRRRANAVEPSSLAARANPQAGKRH